MVDNSDVIDAQGNVKRVRKVIRRREEWDNPTTSQAPYDWSWFISNFMTSNN